jgi:hypothetical protein
MRPSWPGAPSTARMPPILGAAPAAVAVQTHRPPHCVCADPHRPPHPHPHPQRPRQSKSKTGAVKVHTQLLTTPAKRAEWRAERLCCASETLLRKRETLLRKRETLLRKRETLLRKRTGGGGWSARAQAQDQPGVSSRLLPRSLSALPASRMQDELDAASTTWLLRCARG